jgi:HD-GYP domain-containing protein (c-di-GMP phosphodiesterase class II)
VSARVIAVADVAEAMLSHRPYRPALTLDEVVEELTAPGDGGPRYDAGIANACIALLSEGRFAF